MGRLQDMEDQAQAKEKKLKYPKSVFFIVSNEFCERFSFYGMKTILALYLNGILKFSEDDSTVIYHGFNVMCYFTPLMGAILADSLLGKFKTILYVSLVYALGNIVLSFAALPPLKLPPTAFSLLGLVLIAIGTGGIKPCVSAFGGDQFKLPEQQRQLQSFFSVFYFSINAGSLISTFLTPILREDVKCYGDDTCYSLAFGVPAVLMIVSLLLFLFGKSLYIIKEPTGNVVLQVARCMNHAVKRKWAQRHRVSDTSSKEKRTHWLDWADDKFDRILIEDIKSVLHVLLLFVPLPVFWALFDQQGSRWTFQATRMDGEIGGYTIKPDQMQVVNPFLILAFIPIFEAGVYPLFAKCGLLVKPLQRMFVGGILAGVAFVVSGIVELRLEPTYPDLPTIGTGHLAFINSLPCNVDVRSSSPVIDVTVSSRNSALVKHLPVHVDVTFPVEFKIPPACLHDYPNGTTFPANLTATEKESRSVLIGHKNGVAVVYEVSTPDSLDKSKSGRPKLRILYDVYEEDDNSQIELRDGVGKTVLTFLLNGTGELINATEHKEAEAGVYRVWITGNRTGGNITRMVPSSDTIHIRLGGVYTLLVESSKDKGPTSALFTLTEPNSIHMLWLIPQFFVITVAEIMVSITGLEFSFTQSPISMKSVLQAAWLLTVSFGNLIVVIVAEAKFFKRQSMEFFLFAGLMGLDMIVFLLLSMRYKYVDIPNEDTKEVESESKIGRDNPGFDQDTPM